MNKRTELLHWMLVVKVFKTSDVLAWGCTNFSNRACRNSRDFAEKGEGRDKGLIHRLSDFEKGVRGYNSKEGYYEINEKKIKDYLQPKLF